MGFSIAVKGRVGLSDMANSMMGAVGGTCGPRTQDLETQKGPDRFRPSPSRDSVTAEAVGFLALRAGCGLLGGTALASLELGVALADNIVLYGALPALKEEHKTLDKIRLFKKQHYFCIFSHFLPLLC